MPTIQSRETIQNLTEQAAATRKCNRCRQVKPIFAFAPIKRTSQLIYSWLCTVCSEEYEARRRKWAERRRKNSASDSAKFRQSVRTQVINAYGGKCACCGETEPKLLTIDHVNNDGAEHRRKLNIKGGWVFYSWIIKNNFPKNLQLLCFNCNCAKGFFGKCPHLPSI